MKPTIAARASLLRMTKSAIDGSLVLETEALFARDQLVAELEAELRRRPRQVLDEAQAENRLQELKPQEWFVTELHCITVNVHAVFHLMRREEVVLQIRWWKKAMTCFSRNNHMEVNHIALPSVLNPVF